MGIITSIIQSRVALQSLPNVLWKCSPHLGQVTIKVHRVCQLSLGRENVCKTHRGIKKPRKFSYSPRQDKHFC